MPFDSFVSYSELIPNGTNIQLIEINSLTNRIRIRSGSSGLTANQIYILTNIVLADYSGEGYENWIANDTLFTTGADGSWISYNSALSGGNIDATPNKNFYWNVDISNYYYGSGSVFNAAKLALSYFTQEYSPLSESINSLFVGQNKEINSNLYAERIFSQHPVALWPLDDDISYIQLLNEEQRQLGNISQWLSSSLVLINNINYDAKSNIGYQGFGINSSVRTNYANGNGFSENYLPITRSTATCSSAITPSPIKIADESLLVTFANDASVSKNGVFWDSTLSGNLSSVSPNTNYHIFMYIRQKNTTYGTYRLRITKNDLSLPPQEVVIASKQLNTVDSQWYQLSGTFTTGPETTDVTVDLEVNNGSGQEIYVDGVLFEETEVPLPHISEIDSDVIIDPFISSNFGFISNNTTPTTVSFYDTGTPNARFYPTASVGYIESIFSLNTASSTYSTYFDENKSTACFSTFVYVDQPLVNSFEIGIKYDSTVSSTTYSVLNKSGWVKLSHTFDIPKNKTIKFFINTVFNSVYFNLNEIQFAAVTFGQWSENYNSYTIGYTPLDLETKFNTDGIPLSLINNVSDYSYKIADSYGLDTSTNGMYLIKSKEVYAETYGVPMVFGSTNTTKIYKADDDNPSIILPGQGFLNESGIYNNYTFEAWIRLENLSIIPVRIIGPVKSNDGVYVEEGFISLRIGDYSKSYFVGKWYRPMLLNITYSTNSVSLFINGAKVISISIDAQTISTFPDKDYDWIGIYGNEFINPFEIDCISITPYIVPETVLKKRFVYGQGTGEIRISTNEVDADTALIDYSASKYATNVIYPDVSKWSEGFSINAQETSTYLTTPSYTLPEVLFSNNSTIQNTSDWLKSNFYYNVNGSEFAYPYIIMNPAKTNSWSYFTGFDGPNKWNEYISLYWDQTSFPLWDDIYIDDPTPGIYWSNYTDGTWGDILTLDFNNNSSIYSAESTIYYKNINILNGDLSSIVGVFSTTSSLSTHQSLMYFKNNLTNDYLDIYISGGSLIYSYNSTILYTENIGLNKYFTAGINIDNFATKYFGTVKNFFDNLNMVSLNIGGLFTNSFTGKIYAIHFSNSYFYDKDLVSYFDNDQVFVKQTSTYYFMNYTANYSLLPILYNSTMVLDIGTSSYWEDYQPFSFFGKYIKNSGTGFSYYDLDMMQFNIDMPNVGTIATYTYEDLKDIYATYFDLKYGGIQSSVYQTYSQLKSNFSTTFQNIELDTGINVYLSFQKAEDVGKILYRNLTNQSLSSSKVIEFNSSSYSNKKYEITDGTVIIPPKYPDFQNYYVGIHIEYKVRGINTKGLYIRRMELASVAYDEDTKYSIGTRYGNELHPFVRDGNTFLYKLNNPFTIYKNTSPYLYLTEDSGIYVNNYQLDASVPNTATRGVYLDINQNNDSDFELAGIQFWCRYPKDEMPNSDFIVASIISASRTIELWAKPESDKKRIKIVAKENNQEIQDYIFYIDGNVTQNPYLETKTWSSIAISLTDIFDLSNQTGRLELYSGLTFNTISTYKYLSRIVGSIYSQKVSWYELTQQINPSALWSTINSVYASWDSIPGKDVKVGAYAIDADKIYKNAVGLANTVHEDLSRISINSNGVDTFTDVELKLVEAIVI